MKNSRAVSTLLLAVAVLAGIALWMFLGRTNEQEGSPGLEGLRAEIATLKSELAGSRAEVVRLRSIGAAEQSRPGPPPSPAPGAVIAPEEGKQPVPGTDPGIRVKARDDRGAPMPGLRAVVKRFAGGGWQEKEGLTDPAGMAVFAELQEGNVTVQLWKGRTVRTTDVSIFKGQGIKEVEFRFPTCVPVTGVVTHVQKGPLADVNVISSFHDSFGSMAAQTRSDSAGRYTVELPPGSHELAFYSKGLSGQKRYKIDVPQGASEVRADITVGVLSLRGMVRLRETRDPIPAAEVELDAPYHRLLVASDEGGKFAFEDLPGGKYKLTVRKSGFGTAEFAEVEVPDVGAAPDLDVALAPLADVELEVITPNGRHQVGLVHVGWNVIGANSGKGANLVCDENGLAHLTYLVPGEWRLWVTADGVGKADATVTIVSGKNLVKFQLVEE